MNGKNYKNYYNKMYSLKIWWLFQKKTMHCKYFRCRKKHRELPFWPYPVSSFRCDHSWWWSCSLFPVRACSDEFWCRTRIWTHKWRKQISQRLPGTIKWKKPFKLYQCRRGRGGGIKYSKPPRIGTAGLAIFISSHGRSAAPGKRIWAHEVQLAVKECI